MCGALGEVCGTMAPKKKNTTWNYSKGQALLRTDVRSGKIPSTMDWQTAYNLHFRPEFEVGETPEEAKRLFEGRLARCCSKARHEKEDPFGKRASFDAC